MDVKEKVISALSYLWVLFFLPLVLIPESEFGKFHANQALLNLLLGVVFAIIEWIFPGLSWICNIIIGLFALWGIVSALLGLKKPYPVIGKYTFIK
jgi:uncharacterized membrane protein